MIVLGIETSCDDTSAAVYDGNTLLSNIISTQLIHSNFGGVVPELASRAHIRMVLPVIREALKKAGIKTADIRGIGVTYGPGLAGSLLVGLSIAKGLALSLDIPMIGINHLEGHIWSNYLANPGLNPPIIVLIVSGGHTQLVYVREWGSYKLLGRTRDDASGEAFDKVAKMLDLGYPGGPFIEKLALNGNPEYIRFPRAYLEEGSLDFSFSGLKTAVLNHVRRLGKRELKKHISDIAACFQDAVVDVLVQKSIYAAENNGVKRICVAGGVAVNRHLQKKMKQACNEKNIELFWPPANLCTDNGGMIAAAAHFYLKRGVTSPLTLSPRPSLNF